MDTGIMKAKDITKTDPLFWRKLGDLLVQKIRLRVQKKSMNYQGQKFNSYSRDYAEAKQERTAAGAGVSQASTEISSPDMTLTGKTMADLAVRQTTKDHVIIGWMGIHGAIVDSLSKIKNYKIIGEGKSVLHESEENAIVDAVAGNIQKQINKFHAEKKKINIHLKF